MAHFMDYYSWIQRVESDPALICLSYSPFKLTEPFRTTAAKIMEVAHGCLWQQSTLRVERCQLHLLVLFQSSGSQNELLWPAALIPHENLADTHLGAPATSTECGSLGMGLKKLFQCALQMEYLWIRTTALENPQSENWLQTQSKTNFCEHRYFPHLTIDFLDFI